MVRFFVFVYLFFACFYLAHSQIENLVPNPSFEEHSCCPCEATKVDCAEPWFIYSDTPEYFNNCYNNSNCDTNGIYGFGIPQNSFGFQMAKDGSAYIGAAILIGGGSGYIGERVGVELLKTLEKDVNYCYSFWVSLADSSEFNGYDANIGFIDTKESYITNLDLNLHFIKNDNKQLFPLDAWLEISGTFVAKGFERFLIIGNLKPLDSCYTIPTGLENWSNSAYVYFDLVSVYDCDSAKLPEPPNLITPNGDGINDVWTFSDKYNSVGNIEIFNRWGNVVYKRKAGEEILWNSSKVSSGVYFYIIQGSKDSNKQKRGTITVLGGP